MKEVTVFGYDAVARMMGNGDLNLEEVFPEFVEEQRRVSEKRRFVPVDEISNDLALDRPGVGETFYNEMDDADDLAATMFLIKHGFTPEGLRTPSSAKHRVTPRLPKNRRPRRLPHKASQYAMA